jgi:NAD+ synthase
MKAALVTPAVLMEGLRIQPAAVCDEIVAFIRREVNRLGKRGVVLGLSGGLDSSVCAYLCARALPPQRILALLLPERDSDPTNLQHARKVAQALQLPVQEVQLSPLLQQIGVYDLASAELAANRRTLETAIAWVARLTGGPSAFSFGIGYTYASRNTFWKWLVRRFLWRYAGQIQAFVLTKVRLRMLLLYHYAALNDCLVVGTTDKSEWSIGFYDPYGDGASDLALLRHLYKTQIRELGRYLGVSEAILNKPSSGDLAAGLPNEAVIGLTYEELDVLLYGLEQGYPPGQLARQLPVSRAAVAAVQEAMQAANARQRLPLHLPG